ncbi:MAG: STAS domain-containing protein [Candidatus Lindowbacteria bacterium]|nr:STAS domain-containing protein [Candidatus Lindowbacteria bacterium]
MEIVINVRTTGMNTITVIYMNGDVYPEDMQAFTTDLKRTVNEIDIRKVVLNMGKVNFLPSLALGQLVAFQKKIKKSGGSVKICSLTPNIDKVFKLTRFDTLFDMYGSEEEAIKAYGTF